jgi:hypothetical protein
MQRSVKLVKPVRPLLREARMARCLPNKRLPSIDILCIWYGGHCWVHLELQEWSISMS